MHTSASIIRLVGESSLTEVMCSLNQLHDQWLERAESLDGDGNRDALRCADIVGELLGALVQEDREALDAELTKTHEMWVSAQTDYDQACETANAAAGVVLARLQELDAMLDNPPSIAAVLLPKLPLGRTGMRRSIRRTSHNEVYAFTQRKGVSHSDWFDFLSDTLPTAIDQDLSHYAALRASQGHVVESTNRGQRISQVREGSRWMFYKLFDAVLKSPDVTQFKAAIEALKRHRDQLLAIESQSTVDVANELLRNLPVWSLVDQNPHVFKDLRTGRTLLASGLNLAFPTADRSS